MAENLPVLRKKLKLSQEGLADIIGSSFLTHFSPETVDYFLESKLITEKEIAMADGDVSVTVRYVLSKLKTALPKAHELLPSLLSAIKTGARRIRAAEAIPPAYNEKDFAEWAQKYES